jgi:hypothetical protein
MLDDDIYIYIKELKKKKNQSNSETRFKLSNSQSVKLLTRAQPRS